MFLLCSHSSPLTEGVSGDEPLAERGMRRLQARLVTSSQGAQSPSAPDEGAAFNGWTGLDERRRQCCPDSVSGNALRSRPRSSVAVSKIAAVERRKARLSQRLRAGGSPSQKVPQLLSCVLTGAPPPSGEANKRPERGLGRQGK